MQPPVNYETSCSIAFKLSVLICTYNGANRISETLERLAAQALVPKDKWEVLLINNASSDNTAGIASQISETFPVPMRVLHEARPGKASALRTAFFAARGEYYCIVDDDNLLEPDYLANGIDFLDRHPSLAFIGGRTIPRFPAGTTPPADFQDQYAPFLACYDNGPEIIWNYVVPGAGQMGRVALLRGIYEQIGTRLEDRVGDGVGCCEDLEKGNICRRLGWQCAHVPTLRLYHVLTTRRLTSTYIDDLSCAAVSTIPWLRLVSGDDPDSVTWRTLQGISDVVRVVKYYLLSFAPPGLHPKLGRVSFWRRYYAARLRGYLSLMVDRRRIRAMLIAIRNAPAELRPPSEVDSYEAFGSGKLC